MFKVFQHHLQLFRLEAIIIKKLGHRFKMALTDQNFTIKIAKRENIEKKNWFLK